jgi:hypothetical protein
VQLVEQGHEGLHGGGRWQRGTRRLADDGRGADVRDQRPYGRARAARLLGRKVVWLHGQNPCRANKGNQRPIKKILFTISHMQLIFRNEYITLAAPKLLRHSHSGPKTTESHI